MEFIYSGNGSYPPWNVTHVTIDPSVKEIGFEAFYGCTQLIHVELGEVERIDLRAFCGCTSLANVIIPSTVKVIAQEAFMGCTQLIHVELGEGLDLISSRVFKSCTLLHRIYIPSSVTSIARGAFLGCTHLRNLELSEGLREIGPTAFADCTSLENVHIPSTVEYLAGNSFENCTSMAAICFCEEIEEFLALLSIQDWWNHGRSSISLESYNRLIQYSILQRTSSITMMRGRTNIHAMVRRISSIVSNPRHLDYLFDIIDSELSVYERLQADVAPLLMLAIWKSKMSDIDDGYACDSVNVDEMKVKGRYDSESMASVIVPNVLDFLCHQVNEESEFDSDGEFRSDREHDYHDDEFQYRAYGEIDYQLDEEIDYQLDESDIDDEDEINESEFSRRNNYYDDIDESEFSWRRINSFDWEYGR